MRKFLASLSALAVASSAFVLPTFAAPPCNGSSFDSFALGSINGQGGWMVTGPYDQEVVDNEYGFADFGCKTWRFSNAVATGSFGDQTFSFSTPNEAGEADSTNGGQSGGVRQSHFEAAFDIASTMLAEQPGLFISVSPDRGDGSRMSYLGFGDTPTGIDVTFYDVQGTSNPANFVSSVIATLSRTEPHTIKFVMDFLDGPSNDVVKIYIDDVLVHTGTSWENYFRYDSESSAEQTPRTTDSLLFRSGGSSVPANDGNGFIFDNVSLSTFTPGQLAVQKYSCPADTVPTRATNGPDANGAHTIPAGCVPAQGVNFGYIHQADKMNYTAPYPGLEDATPYTLIGMTDVSGAVVASGLDPMGRYDVAELSSTGSWVEDPGMLGFFCAGDSGVATNNYEIAFVPSGGTTYCVAYNELPPVCGNGDIEEGEQCDDGNAVNGDGCSATCQDQALACMTTDFGLLAHWAFDEGTGTTANDTTTHNNVGTLENGAAFSGDVPAGPLFNNSSVQLDGSNDVVDVADTTDLDFDTSDEFSASAWVKPASLAGDYKTIIQKIDDNTAARRGYLLTVTPAGVAQVYLINNFAANNHLIATANTPLTAGVWQQVGFSYDGSGDAAGVKIYVNGADVTGAPVHDNLSGTIDHTQEFEIGRRSDANAQAFNGNIDDVRVYGAELSATEMNALFTSQCDAGTTAPVCGNGTEEGAEQCDDGNVLSGDGCSATCMDETNLCAPVDTDLSAYWKGDEGAGVVANDSTTHNNVGTLENGATWSSAAAPLGFANPNAFSFDGTDDYVLVSDVTGLPSGGSARTVSAWINQDTISHQASIVALGNADDGNQKFIVLMADVAGTTYLFTDGINPSNNITVTGGEIPSTDTWHHIAFRYDGANNWSYFLDGSHIKSGTFAVPINTVVNAAEIGARHDNANGGFFDGELDDVRVYNNALTNGEIADLYAGMCEPAVVVDMCGNGVITGAEACDDGNTADGDGCSSACAVESGYECIGEPSVCAAVCGDDIVTAPETCDDGALNGEPNQCNNSCSGITAPSCGNNAVEAGEMCDDGNAVNGDGCSATCTAEGPLCDGVAANIFVSAGKIVGGPDDGKTYNGTLKGTAGNDVMAGTGGNDKIKGQNGNDTICGFGGHDELDGANGDDRLFGAAGNDELDGGNNDDYLEGNEGNDELDGGNGDDEMIGGIGNDELDGGGGNDFLAGSAGNDELDAGTGTDILCGGTNNDTLEAGSANDKLDGGPNTDKLKGESGTDICRNGESLNSCENTVASVPECVGF